MSMKFLIASAYAATDAVSTPIKKGGGIFDMMMDAGPMVKTIMLGLLVLSVLCWFVIFSKFKLFRRSVKESQEFINLFMQRKNYVALYKESEFLSESHLAN